MLDSINIRNIKIEDINKVVELENKIWPEGTRASRNKFESRYKIFPQGFFMASKNNQIIGASTSEIINYDINHPPISWEHVTDNGFIEKSHNPNGNALYVVSIGAISRSGAGSALLGTQKKLKQKLNLQFLILGARIPGYDSYCNKNGEISINDYVNLKRGNGELLDSELRFYTRNGLKLSKIIPNYMEDDKESRNFGALFCYE